MTWVSAITPSLTTGKGALKAGAAYTEKGMNVMIPMAKTCFIFNILLSP
ncbi:hypothetical protein GPS63_11370 [Acinetobacter haemolyticus]|nr:hypothetical protein [Acinetobacter haemolyticus]NAR18893.1 hypothetical protein [Acinetobacter haemolyticus]